MAWLVAAIVALATVQLTLCDTVVPTSGMVIKESTTLTPGTYQLTDGLTIAADFVTLSMNGAVLVGTDFQGVGVTVDGCKNVTITNGTTQNFYYGVKAVNADGLTVAMMNSSFNWLDPAARILPTPPWLDINVAPSAYGDRTNLGGGMWLENVSHALVEFFWGTYQENGIDAFNVTHSVLTELQLSNNSGWGLHMWRSSYNDIFSNNIRNVTRGQGHYTCDTSAVLLNCGSHYNTVHHSSILDSGDNVWITGFPRDEKDECCPSNFNQVYTCNLSGSPNNAVECTFGRGNQIYENMINGSNYGVWGGYSWGNTSIYDNIIGQSITAGIAVDHGLDMVIVNNSIADGAGDGVQLFTDGIAHFPTAKYGCLKVDHTRSSGHLLSGNSFSGNKGRDLWLANTTHSLVYNNEFTSPVTAVEQGTSTGNAWSVRAREVENVVGGPWVAGNFWGNYHGQDTTGNGIGNTLLPYTDGGKMELPGDTQPLVMPKPKPKPQPKQQ